MYRIGLTVGTASVGWSVMDIAPDGTAKRIIALNSRCYEPAEVPKTGESLAKSRRGYRSMRRIGRRRKGRKNRIKSLIQNTGIITKDELAEVFKKHDLTNIYQIRTEALDRKLDNEELARLLVHLSQRRGYKSNRKNEANDKDTGVVLTAIAENEKLMLEKGYRTIGEMLYKDEKFAIRKHNSGKDYISSFSRQQYENEIDAIFAAQQKYGNEYISAEFIEKFKAIYFAQRAFDEGPGGNSPYGGNLIDKMVGYCTFEPKEKRAPKASFTFEDFTLRQTLNHTRLISNYTKRSLTKEEIEKIYYLCYKSPKVTYTKIRETIGMKDEDFFAGLTYPEDKKREEIEKKTFVAFPSFHEMRKAFNTIKKGYIENISIDQRDAIALALSYYKTDDKILAALEPWNFTEEEKEVILTMKNFSKFGALSVKAMRNILPFLEEGLTYDKACEKAGYDFKAHGNNNVGKFLPKLPNDIYEITSPVVKRAVNQTIKIVNSIINDYGSPAAINIQTARELHKSHKERLEIEKQNKENQLRNEKIRDIIKKEYKIISPSGQDIIKYRLYEEQKGVCLYTNTALDKSRLFDTSYCEISHIIPMSRSFDDSYNNKVLALTSAVRKKGQLLPLEIVESPDDYKALVNTLYKAGKKKNNLLRPKLDYEDAFELKQRSLQDTQHITSFLANYINDHLIFDEEYEGKRRVFPVTGTAVSLLKKRWGIGMKKEDGDKWKAVDATVIASLTPALIGEIEKHYSYWENRLNNDNSQSNRFPYPYEEFRKELLIRLSNNPSELLKEVPLRNYADVDLDTIKPIIVSRRERNKQNGAGHDATLRSKKMVFDGRGNYYERIVTRTPITKLRLDKEGEIADYFFPTNDLLLYNHLKEKITEAGGDAKKAFPEGFTMKPNPKGEPTTMVKSVKLSKASNLYVPLDKAGGVADNGSRARLDIYYSAKDEKYYAVPIYFADLVKKEIPRKACVPQKPYSEWKEMDPADFLFSLYPNSLLRIERVKPLAFHVRNEDSSLPQTIERTSEIVYYKGFDISSNGLEGITPDGAYKFRNFGIHQATHIDKLYIDVLGNIYNSASKNKK